MVIIAEILAEQVQTSPMQGVLFHFDADLYERGFAEGIVSDVFFRDENVVEEHAVFVDNDPVKLAVLCAVDVPVFWGIFAPSASVISGRYKHQGVNIVDFDGYVGRPFCPVIDDFRAQFKAQFELGDLFFVKFVGEIIADKPVIEPDQLRVETVGGEKVDGGIDREHSFVFVLGIYDIHAAGRGNICFHKVSDRQFHRIGIGIFQGLIAVKFEGDLVDLFAAHFYVPFCTLLGGDKQDLSLF